MPENGFSQNRVILVKNDFFLYHIIIVLIVHKRTETR